MRPTTPSPEENAQKEMSATLPQDTSPPAPQPSLDTAGSAPPPRVPWRARRSLLWQGIVLRIRFAFRLPIDDIKDEYIERREQDIQRLYANQQKIFATLESLTKVSNQMQSRLSYYEKRDPGLRELRKAWEREQQRLKAAVEDAQDSGILHLAGGNGRIIRP